MLTNDELADVERWCAKRLVEYGQEQPAAPLFSVCDYDPLLPSHSIRAQLVALVGELRAERTRTETLRAALETLTRCIHEARADGETFPVRVSVACHAADELLAASVEETQ